MTAPGRDMNRKELVVRSPPHLCAEDVALLRTRSTQPPTRSTPLANTSSPAGPSNHYSTMPPDGFETPRWRQASTSAGEREESGIFSQSLPYSWTDSSLDESDSQMRQRWLSRQTFGPVLQSEGGHSTTVSTPYAHRNPEDVWGARGQPNREASPVQTSCSDQENNGRLVKPLSFISYTSTVIVTTQPGKRNIVRTRQVGPPACSVSPSLSQTRRSVAFAAPPLPVAASRPSEAPPSTDAADLPRTESKRRPNKGLARGRAVRAIFEEDDFFQ